MTRHMMGLTLVIGLALGLVAAPTLAQEDSSVTGAGAGIYVPSTSYAGVSVSGLKFGIGLRILPSGTAKGLLHVTLLGTSALGQPQDIVVEGTATAGSATPPSTTTFSGTATVDMGDGTPLVPGVPFTVTIVTNADDQGTLTLLLGVTNLPGATVNEGVLSIK